MRSAVLALAICLVLPAAVWSQEEEAVTVFGAVGGSVVRLQNVASSGTGIILSKNGLILTNAHVVAVPMPFKCIVDLKRGDKEETVMFQKVTVLGVHPTLDLALVGIDPKEHGAELRPAVISKEKATTGQRVYAVGNPASGGKVKLTKTITAGLLSGVDRVIENVSYYQISAAVNPGNSGGPLCDRTGKVIGLVTLKSGRLENVGFALPLQELDPKEFKPMTARKPDLERASQMIEAANKIVKQINELKKTNAANNPQVDFYRVLALQIFHEALVANPRNPTVYSAIGEQLKAFKEYEAAEPYYLQALEIDPWSRDGRIYRSYGNLMALLNKADEAEAIWLEGVAKHPTNAMSMWDDLAMLYKFKKDYVSAASCVGFVLAQPSSPERIAEAKKTLGICATALKGTPESKLVDLSFDKLGLQLQARVLRRNLHLLERRPILTKKFADFMAAQKRTLTAANSDMKGVVSFADTKDIVVDLMANLRSAETAPTGWAKEKLSMRSLAEGKSRLAVAGRLPEEYDVVLEVERKSGEKEVAFSFLHNNQPSIFVVDAGGTKSGIVGRREGLYEKPVLAPGELTTVVLRVRKDKAWATAAGRPFFEVAISSPLPEAPEKWQFNKALPWLLESNQSEFVVHGWWLIESLKAPPKKVAIDGLGSPATVVPTPAAGTTP